MIEDLEQVTFGNAQELQDVLESTDEPVFATAEDGARFVAMSVATYRNLCAAPEPAAETPAQSAHAQATGARVRYTAAELPYTPIDSADYQRSTYNDAIVDRMRKVMQAEAPVERQRLFNTVRASFGIKRSGQDIQSQNEWLMNRRLEFKTTEFNGATFLWLPDQDPETYDIFRTVAEGSERQVSEIPYEELANAIMAALGHGVALSRDELIDAAMRLLGYKRRTNRVREVLGTAIERAAEEDRIRLFTDGTFRSSRR